MSMIISAVGIFFLRLFDTSLGTLRLVMVVRGRKGLAGALGFLQALVFVTALTGVLQNLDNIFNILGYAGGFAAGIMLGMAIEERLAIGFGHVRIISAGQGAAVAAALRAGGYGATELIGRGPGGECFGDQQHCAPSRRDAGARTRHHRRPGLFCNGG